MIKNFRYTSISNWKIIYLLKIFPKCLPKSYLLLNLIKNLFYIKRYFKIIVYLFLSTKRSFFSILNSLTTIFDFICIAYFTLSILINTFLKNRYYYFKRFIIYLIVVDIYLIIILKIFFLSYFFHQKIHYSEQLNLLFLNNFRFFYNFLIIWAFSIWLRIFLS